MTVFVDTSALYALFDRDDQRHAEAQTLWQDALEGGLSLATSNYVLLETMVLLQSRLGMEAVRDLENAIVPILSIIWVDAALHRSSVAMLLTANRRQLSLVDCVSFAACQESDIRTVFAFDAHFSERGFQLLAADQQVD